MIRILQENDELEFDIEEPQNQEYDSADTSINSSKAPSVFKLVKSWEPGTINLDYGGGKFDTGTDYLSQYDVINLVYDPYNRTSDHNREVLKLIRENGGADTVTCSNVLNVIKEPEVRANVISNIKKLLKSNGTAYFTVYIGDKSGEGKVTKSGYQLNRDTKDYIPEIEEVFGDVSRKGKLIIANK